MTKLRPLIILIIAAVVGVGIIFIVKGMGGDMNSMPGMNMGEGSDPEATTAVQNVPVEVLSGNTISLTAKPGKLQIDDKTTKDVWTYNGSVPGPQLRVKQGEMLNITLNNELPEPTTIHWHGLPVPNGMDGIPGVTMNAVQPGESFTYQFKADVPGTYWYHSHQNGVEQVDKGLYGTFIVEPADEEKPARDYTVVLDEWMEQEMSGGMDMGGNGDGMSGMDMGGNEGGGDMSGMDMGGNGGMSGANTEGMSEAEMMPLMYTIFTANGRSGAAIEPLKVKQGEKVRIRLVNAGYMSHQLHLQGQDFKIVSTDGQPINNPPSVNGQLLNIAPGERYDIEFEANNPGNWLLEEHSTNPGAKGLKIPIAYEGFDGEAAKADNDELPLLDITKYGEAAQSRFTLDQKYDVEYTMDLNTETKDGEMAFTINGKTFPDTEPINVKTGDLVKVKLVNKSPEDIHPMHLHGMFFQVLSKNGVPVSGSPLVKDTLNVLPGEEYEIAFLADNPGNWLFHCHDLGHAAAGMVTQVKYDGFKPDFTVDPNANNQPE
ncbi:MAG TPA: multicopper oxidase family protein [Paenibacillus sp.]|uniref:multicopper oxidase family protein n=1 Tax=Paenibacillus sp. TaxID=58172 RepID=UPI002C4B7B9E|nr:multicopper oxidase family protein [Paenibacillus sp.]HUC91185.1 multicopper oxidase family protein [Paenibacillus sp.]